MLTLLILTSGLVIVVGGILFCRLPAFIALVLAGLAVAVLTPAALIERSVVLEKSVRVSEVALSGDGVELTTSAPVAFSNAVLLEDYGPGRDFGRNVPAVISGAKSSTDNSSGKVILTSADANSAGLTAAISDRSTADASWLLVSAADYATAQKTGQSFFMARFTGALGDSCGSLAIMIVAASVIGRCLLDSGAAEQIVTASLRLVGERLAPAAFVVSGFVLGIPVFFDTVFYLMIPLGKALTVKTGRNYLLYVLSIVAGGTMAHSLVPPTPGPLFIAAEFGVRLPAMIIGGCLVGLFASACGMIYAVRMNRHCELPLRDLPTPADTPDGKTALPEDSEPPQLPGLMISLVPILLPVVLIAAGAFLPEGSGQSSETTFSVSRGIRVLSDRNAALLISAAVSVFLLVHYRRRTRDELGKSLQHAVTSAGTIILVTGAGGAFGRMMRHTSVAELLEGLSGTSPVMIVTASFLVTTAVRTAQGSATVAMITAAGIFGGLVTSGAAGVDPLYVALAVGCGSKPFAWMNDSGFWVITRMSGM
ncbi:MAG: GntP family permease, partial [Planctomycetaceae bacterium]|nr:GntP family permease [Planctomycetaceae bacterium]